MDKGLELYFTRDGIQMTYKNRERCSTTIYCYGNGNENHDTATPTTDI